MKNYINLANKYKLFIFLSMPALLILARLACLQINSNSLNTTIISQITQWLIDIINILLIISILKKRRIKIENIGLLTSIASLFLVDIIYFTVYSLPQKRQYSLIFDVAHFTFYTVTITFITYLLLNNALKAYKFAIALLFSIIIDIGIFSVFSIGMRYLSNHTSLSLNNKIQIAQYNLELIIFSLAFLWLIYSKKLGSTLIAAGYIILISSEFMITSCYMTKMLCLLAYGELGWLLGLIFIMTGMIFVVINNQYNIKEWMETTSTIRSKLIFNTFSMVVISLIIFYLILKEFSFINENFYIFFPAIVMDYSLLIAIFSILSSKNIEQTLLQIQNDLEKSLNNNKEDVSA